MMTVNLVQWRAVIGIFNCQSSAISYRGCNLTENFVSMFKVLLYFWHYFESAFIFLLTLVYLCIIGPRKLKTNSFSVCHWNLSSSPAHNFSKLTQLKAYNSIYKYDFICLSQTYLSTSILDNLIDVS